MSCMAIRDVFWRMTKRNGKGGKSLVFMSSKMPFVNDEYALYVFGFAVCESEALIWIHTPPFYLAYFPFLALKTI